MKTILGMLAAAGLLLLFSGGAASANVIFDLSGVTLSSAPSGGTPEGTLTGSFTTDNSFSTVLAVNITASASGSYPGFDYTLANSANNSSLVQKFIRLDSIVGGNELQLDFQSLLNASGATLSAANSYDHEPAGGNRYAIGSVVPAAVPEPGSLSLLSAGLLGLLFAFGGGRWLRRRQPVAA